MPISVKVELLIQEIGERADDGSQMTDDRGHGIEEREIRK